MMSKDGAPSPPRGKPCGPVEQLDRGRRFYAERGYASEHFAAMWHSFNVGQLLVTDLNAISRRHGLSIADFHLLGALMIEDPAPLRASDLAIALNVTNAVLSERIGRLEREGLLRRQRGADRRAFHLTITREGAARVEAIAVALEDESRFVRHFHALPHEDQMALGRIMAALHTAMDRDFVPVSRERLGG